jgi:hypothetical protein
MARVLVSFTIDGDDPDRDGDEPDAETWRQRESAWTGRWWTRVLAAVDPRAAGT